ncbi:MAG: acetyltransferase [Thermosynechococcaceae cyanobacterium]
MFLKHEPSGQLVEVLTPRELWDPFHESVTGRFHAGEEMQDSEPFRKIHLIFPSEEPLPQCWVNPHYRE